MITADDVARITIFADLGEDDRAQLARAAADIALSAGEYAAQQGAERALFGLLDGGIEVVQIVDGVERIVGRREPGDIFGEVPITLGSAFPVGFRASEDGPARVLKLDAHDYHALAAVAPDVASAVGKLASHRITQFPSARSGLVVSAVLSSKIAS